MAAMEEVDRLLTATLVRISETDPADPDAQWSLRRYFAGLDQRFGNGFDPDDSIPAEPGDMRPPSGVFLMARLHGAPVGCGALKFHGDRPTELKRVWVSPDGRGAAGYREVAPFSDEPHATHWFEKIL